MVHHGDLVGHRHRFDLVVRDIDGGGLEAVVQPAQLAAHDVTELRIERAERLVHHERQRPAHDGAAERHALAVAAGQSRDTGRSSNSVIRRMRAASSTRVLISARFTPIETSGKAMFSPHVHVRIEREELEYEGDVAGRGALEA